MNRESEEWPMKRSLAALLLLAGCATAQTAETPQSAARDVAWRGTIRCGIIPGLTTIRLNQPFTLTVSGDRAQYTRAVRQADKSAESGYVEQGGGTVAADGAVVLSGSAQGRGYSYVANYQGRLPPAGGAGHLVGTQQWSRPGFDVFPRPCSMDLSR
jgi:hypothetical protein